MRDKKGYVHCRYLDELEIPLEQQNTNYCNKNDERWEKWKKQRKEYGFDERETWNLDHMFVEWIYTRFKMYKEIGGEMVDLTYHHFTYEDKEITQEEAIDIIIKACEKFLIGYDHGVKVETEEIYYTKLPPEIYKLLGEIMPAMWW